MAFTPEELRERKNKRQRLARALRAKRPPTAEESARKKEKNRAYYLANAERAKAKSREWTAANRERNAATKRSQKLRSYGLDEATFNAMWDQQGGVCKICGKQPDSGRGTLNIDHCHSTGRVRGLLCVTCNVRLGVIENVEWVAAAKLYLGSK